jgi:hypothetical protein
VAHIGELGFATGCLAIEPAVRVAGAGMGIVLALLSVKVAVVTTTPVLGTKALLGSPGGSQTGSSGESPTNQRYNRL